MSEAIIPFLGVDSSALDSSEFVVCPCPYEKTTSYLTGTAQGPRKILEASEQIEFFDSETGTEPFRRGIHTLPFFDYSSGEQQALLEATEKEMFPLFEAKKFVITLGGEHTISIPPIRAAAKAYGAENLSILHFDAHSDMRDAYEGNLFSHASIMRRVHEVVNKTYSIGIRAQCSEERQYLEANQDKFGVLYDHERETDGISLEKILSYLTTPYVYITVDLDYFCPEEMPSVGTPVPGGGHWYETLKIIRQVFEKKQVIGADVVELRPDQNIRSDFYAAQLVYKFMTYSSLQA